MFSMKTPSDRLCNECRVLALEEAGVIKKQLRDGLSDEAERRSPGHYCQPLESVNELVHSWHLQSVMRTLKRGFWSKYRVSIWSEFEAWDSRFHHIA